MALRLVHRQATILTDEQIAFFAEPRTWPEILEYRPRISRFRWLKGIVQLDEQGFGYLEWISGVYYVANERRGQWVLTRRGREYLRRKGLAKCAL